MNSTDGGRLADLLPDMDGLDQSELLLRGGDSLRDEFIYNIDLVNPTVFGQAAIR